jgi:iron(III) transport system ATP-binding protein
VLLPASRGQGCADCALGRIPVRHDRSGESASTLAMVRPAQLEIGADAVEPNAVVEALFPMGAAVEVVLLAGVEARRIELRLPHHEIAGLRPGSHVTVRVDGGAVLYPADAPSAPITPAPSLTPGA